MQSTPSGIIQGATIALRLTTLELLDLLTDPSDPRKSPKRWPGVSRKGSMSAW